MYRIEITADTLAELAGKAATLAAKLNANTDGIWWQKTDAPQKLKKALDASFEQEVAEPAPVDPTPAPKSAPVAETTESQPTTAQPSTTPAPAASASDAPVDKETLRSLVLAVVAAKGRETVEEILSTFGLAKASDVAAEQADELVEALKGAL